MASQSKRVCERGDLYEGFRAGDRDALEQLYLAYVDRVRRIVKRCACSFERSYGAHVVSVDDIVQDVFVRAFTRTARLSYDDTRDYGSYLSTIARNVFRDRLKNGRREMPTDHEQLDKYPAVGASNLVAGRSQWDDPDILGRIRNYLRDLPPEYRAVHHQKYVLGLSQGAAARALGVSRQRIRTVDKKLINAVSRKLVRT